ncbi:MAG: DUF1343 domain-containing protein, partial [Bacteroidetes bacterium]|nr:DUF1343 domain-containing protein [Bacteroidota bacterium]
MSLRGIFISIFLLAQCLQLHALPAVPGAARMQLYLPMLEGKRVAVVMNQTSTVGSALLADTLLARKVKLTTIFVPEHGFRGTADAGAHINNERDSKTGLSLISLYGNNKKLKPAQLENVDIVLYDLQDVGTRFYTYISTLEYVMEACAENKKTLIILDRPNPNGSYIDGPILDTSLRSFVGMQPIPIVYGMTPGEYAKMLLGQAWIKGSDQLKLKVIPCANWKHNDYYELPVSPSPNLQTMNSIYLYPSLCWFEGTVISVGRGTDRPFEQWGSPEIPKQGMNEFMPKSRVGATKPPYEGRMCYGHIATENDIADAKRGIQLEYLMDMYQRYPDKEKFF